MAAALLIPAVVAAPQRLIDVDFLGRSPAIPSHRRVRAAVYMVALLLHAALLVVLVVAQRSRPVRVAPGGVAAGIAAYVPGPVGTAGASPAAARVERPKKPAPTRAAQKTAASQDEPADSGGAGGTSGTQGGGSGPVRLASGAGATLLKKITPIYPRMLETARIPGVVVLDAIIHRDGTIGDITVLNSSNPAFTQSAIAAVKQWLYAPLPYEGIVTVTVNFTAAR